MSRSNRDEFTEKTKLQIAKRVGWLCSFPGCRRSTVGANSTGDAEINVGIAAHICAAVPGGPRYDSQMTSDRRRAAENGIWMCEIHGKAVDANDSVFTVEQLRGWKAQAQRESWQRVLQGQVECLVPTHDELAARVRAAAARDLDMFRHSHEWPSSEIPLTLEVHGVDEPVATSALAGALATLGDLVLVAPPGMGKTTTLFQVAVAMLAQDHGSPIIVSLGDWSASSYSLVDSILRRAAFRDISVDDFRAVASRPGVSLLLDGWNELDGSARARAAAELNSLQRELPEMSLLVSTRKQALDVPISGARVDLLPLNEAQQLQIARALRGEAGVALVDQAWRTAGLRELVAIPLYLTVLLSLPEGTPFPTTKEEVLRSFVDVHESNARRLDVLSRVMHGTHRRFLQELAALATRGATTSLAEDAARRSIAETEDALMVERQITERPQPAVVLETLVSHHMLTRTGDPPGYSFQHQQFQEWYASLAAQALMLAALHDEQTRARLEAEVLNWPAWEEPILFACERLSQGTGEEQAACAGAIRAAFQVDPMLAAEMIYRSGDPVWSMIAPTVQDNIRSWHRPGKVDRAVRFMMMSGRPEFLDEVWPLVTHADSQIRLRALRAARRFRPSILGPEAGKRIAHLPSPVRRSLLQEIAFNSGVDGMDIAAGTAKADPDPAVKAAVAEAFAFRRSQRHLTEVLEVADDNVGSQKEGTPGFSKSFPPGPRR